MNYKNIAQKYKVESIVGRYITNENVEEFCTALDANFEVKCCGFSVEEKPIYSVRFGVGKIKVFMWSQMHGNESTTTKAVFDFLNFLHLSDDEIVEQWKAYFEITFIPILNPDGAKYYTRVNANQVDLNRDSINLSQPESQLLRKLLEDIKPDYAFNLHDQRTIFGVGETGKSAAISFLSPAYNEARDLSDSRVMGMKLIAAINNTLQKIVPGHVGRFDDSFNVNCIGDYVQTLGIPVILIEAGHLGIDYQRENTRELVCISLLKAMDILYKQQLDDYSVEEYLTIIENAKNFYDIEWDGVFSENLEENLILKIQYKEVLENNNVKFVPQIVQIDNKESKFVHNAIKSSCELKDLQGLPNSILEANFTDVVELTVEEVNYLLKK